MHHRTSPQRSTRATHHRDSRLAPARARARDAVRVTVRATVRLVAAIVLAAAGVSASSGAAAVGFEEVSVDEGLVFWRAGDRANADPSFVEIMGGGACWLDHDNDGDQDVFLVNGWYNDTARAEQHRPRSMLYRNEGPREGPDFADATDAAGLDVRGWTQGCSAADYDADGWPDLLVIGHGIQRLFRNLGGTFADVSAAANVSAEGKCPDNPCWGTSAAWADYDRDGCLDLYVINFVSFNITAGGNRGPNEHPGQPNQLYRSRCDGTFEELAAAAGADGEPGWNHGKNWGVSWLDHDNDGWLDIYVASDGVPNILLHNNGDGTFVDLAQEVGVADPRNGMGLAINDCNDDGWEDLFFTHYSGLQENPWWGYDGFYTNDGDGTFTDRSGEGDLAVTTPYVKWGVGWEDFDDDGALDLHVVAGHTENYAWDAEQPHLFWRGDGACHFTDARAAGGRALREERMSRGSSYADWDLDGDLDALAVNLMDQDVELLQNHGAPGRSLSLELRQPGGNPRGIGAKVEVELPGGKVLHRRLMPYQSIHGNHQDALHLGLGTAATVDVTVTWPQDRVVERFEDIAVDDGTVRLHRGGRVQRDVLAPVSALHLDGAAGAPGWLLGAGTVRVTAVDRGAAGVAATTLLLDGDPADPAGTPLPPGQHTLRYRSVDAEGNAEPWQEAVVGRDDEAPGSTTGFDGPLAADGWYEGPIRVTLACADATSGPAALAWRLDDEPWVAYEGPFDLVRPGSHAFAWRCTDRAGRVEAAQVLAFAQDVGAPVSRVLVEGLPGRGGWWRSAVEVRVVAEGGRHPVAEVWFALDDEALAPAGGPVLVGDGRHVARVRSVDAAGRAEPLQAVDLRVDTVPPALRLDDDGPHVPGEGTLLIGPQNRLRPRADEAGSGVQQWEARPDRGSWRPAEQAFRLRVEGAHGMALRAVDAAGNAAEAAIGITLDATPPSLAVVRPGEQAIHLADLAVLPWPENPTAARAALVGPATLEGQAVDGVAGVARVRFVVDDVEAGVALAAPWTWTWDLPPGDGYHRVRIQAVDRVGNAADADFEVVATGDPAAMLPAELLRVQVAATTALMGLAVWRIRPRP